MAPGQVRLASSTQTAAASCESVQTLLHPALHDLGGVGVPGVVDVSMSEPKLKASLRVGLGARKPTLDAEGQVHWPLMFVYPETMQVATTASPRPLELQMHWYLLNHADGVDIPIPGPSGRVPVRSTL